MGIDLFCGHKSKVKVTSHENIAGVIVCTLVSAGFFWSNVYCLVCLLQL